MNLNGYLLLQLHQIVECPEAGGNGMSFPGTPCREMGKDGLVLALQRVCSIK